MYEYRAKVIRVVDGDTLEVMIDLGFGSFRKEKIRLLRVNTPETRGPGVTKESAEYKAGKAATGFTTCWLASTENEIVIQTQKDKTGKYGRYLGEIFAAAGDNVGENLQDAIIEAGHDKNNPLTE